MTIYLDNNATTRIADEAYATMLPFFTDIYGNSHAAHRLGRASNDALEHAREKTAKLVNARPSELIFTSCGSESNAIVLRGFPKNTPRRKVVALAVEHPSVLATLRRLESRGEIRLEVVDIERDGTLDLKRIDAAIDDQTALVSVMMAQNETGVLYPVAEVARIAHQRGALLLVDAVQSVGKVAVDVQRDEIDFLSLSGHKLHAPKGIGALYVREGLQLEPMWLGGGHENGLRSGTIPVPLAVALGVACDLAAGSLGSASAVASLRDQFEEKLLALHPAAVIHGKSAPRLPNTSLVSFPGLFSDEIVARLDAASVCVSGGAACDSGKREPSGVMKAMRVPHEIGVSAVRFSLSRYTTAAEIEACLTALREVVSHPTG